MGYAYVILEELRGDPDALPQNCRYNDEWNTYTIGTGCKNKLPARPDMIKEEETFTSYVLFDKRPGYAEVNVVNEADHFIKSKLGSGELILPAGVSYHFAGSYENQVRSEKTLCLYFLLRCLSSL